MAYRIEYSPTADEALSKLDPQISKRITKFMRERIGSLDNARSQGKHLLDPKFNGHWCYRVGDYRVVCDIQDEVLLIVVIKLGKRDKIYD